MNLKKILLVGILLPVGLLYAQTDFRPGFIITNTNDTLYGQIDYRGDRVMGELCKFQSNDHIITDYTPNDIAAYRFIDSKYYISKEINRKKVFLEYLIKGQLNVYYLRDDTGDHYFIDKFDMPIVEVPYEEGFRKVGNKEVLYKSKTHIGVLNYYTQDASGLQPQVNLLKKPEHSKLIKLAENYHYTVCKEGEECIVFERKQPLIGVVLDFTIGWFDFQDQSKPSLQGGVLVNIWLPRSNEKFYFRTGLLYTELTYTGSSNFMDAKASVYKVPFMFEYIYPPKSIIRPKGAVGFCTYFSNNNWGGGSTLAFMGGLNIQILPSIGCFFEYNLDFVGIMNDIQMCSQSCLAGVSVKF